MYSVFGLYAAYVYLLAQTPLLPLHTKMPFRAHPLCSCELPSFHLLPCFTWSRHFRLAGHGPRNADGSSWFSNNIAPDSKRAVALPITLSFCILAGLIAAQVYSATDAPRYVTGNAVSLGSVVTASCGALTLWFVWRRRNAEKSRLIAAGSTVNKYTDDRGLNFEYVL